MIQKSNIGVGAPSKNANFGPVEYIRILHCFRTFPLFTFSPSPSRMVQGQSGRSHRVSNWHVPCQNRSFVCFAERPLLTTG